MNSPFYMQGEGPLSKLSDELKKKLGIPCGAQFASSCSPSMPGQATQMIRGPFQIDDSEMRAHEELNKQMDIEYKAMMERHQEEKRELSEKFKKLREAIKPSHPPNMQFTDEDGEYVVIKTTSKG